MKSSYKYFAKPGRKGAEIDPMYVPKAIKVSKRHHLRNENVPLDMVTGVLVCVNYADYLDVCLQENHKLLDRIVVVTTPEDNDTIKVCSKYSNVDVIKTRCFYDDGCVFDKGKALNKAIAVVERHRSSWVLIMDADIVLPINFKERTAGMKLNTVTLYGAPRHFAYGRADYEGFKATGFTDYGLLRDYYSPGNFPIGYFQLFNSMNLVRRGFTHPYPEGHNDASYTDLQFTKKFLSRGCIRDIHTIHLGPAGVNHQGRITPFFGMPGLGLPYPDCKDAHEWSAVTSILSRQQRRPITPELVKYIRDNPIYISMTTSPLRIDKLGFVLNTLDMDFVEEVLLCIPAKYRNEEEYHIPDWINDHPQIRLVRNPHDLGPANKSIPALQYLKQNRPQAKLIHIDDDTAYSFSMVTEFARALMENHGVVVTGNAPHISNWDIKDHKGLFDDQALVAEGFSGVSYSVSEVPQGYIDDVIRSVSMSKLCKFSDDMVCSKYYKKHGLRVLVVKNEYYNLGRVIQLEYGFRSDAIYKASGLENLNLNHSDRGDGVNIHKYQLCYEEVY